MTASEIDVPSGPHEGEPHRSGGLASRLNWLRAAVLGANDGIVSTAGIVIGAVGATSERSAIVIAGVAGLAAGAMSMGAGEYVSVSTQRDSELALLDRERQELAEMPDEELAELTALYVEKGLDESLAQEVAEALTRKDALGAHAEVELGIDPDDISSPWHAAWASMLSFTVGALLPLLTMTLAAPDLRLWLTVGAVVVALAATGFVSARLGYAKPGRAVVRNMAGGLFAMAVTYAIGSALGTQIG
ncbi:VIT1/CCC1 transporter family protein [Nocardioides sp. LMS-CY]|uniref:VIT1/CCC1 family predicted Fe2+/Mn2+ transporter n=1 Tax=Nocardioides soli TaxID=1036020 RepID=A0A7W4VVL9_9ACTN|nr:MULTISPECIES: VIT family protein [Nocardioides]MBB3042480.1 VIT1/CCC1 family predicted Fe2+/Mn2+ transporter [Nocardioides soli]QWF22623.1 VIT1/CCC1 transporter family protein [Nocardioides sp. LMS-CY]